MWIEHILIQEKNTKMKLFLSIWKQTKIEAVNSIEVKNNILMEKFPNQKNIIKLNINGVKKTFLLTNKKYKDLLKF